MVSATASISLRQRVLCIALFLVCALVVVLHSTNYFLIVAPTGSGDSFVSTSDVLHSPFASHSSLSSCSAQQRSQFHVEVLPALKDEPPFGTPFRSPEIELHLSKLAGSERASPSSSMSDNSVPVSAEEIEIAKNNWVCPFESRHIGFRKLSSSTSSASSTLMSAIWEKSQGYIGKRAASNAPIVLVIDAKHLDRNVVGSEEGDDGDDESSSVAQLYHAAHENATILSVSRQKLRSSRRLLQFSPPAASEYRTWLQSRDAKNGFGTFFQTCNFIAQTFLIDPTLVFARDFVATSSRPRRFDVVQAVLSALPMSMHVFALLASAELAHIEGKLSGSNVDELRVEVKQLLCVKSGCNSGQATSCAMMLVAFHVLFSRRVCSKTWGAPLEQWGRRLFASRSAQEGIRFQVVETEKKKSAAAAAGAAAATLSSLGRLVHPLQYIPSVNLDTLLGAGIAAPARLRLLADMVRTPRYSDPLPHNWVVGRGGRAIRIDRVDKRYDRDVDETKGYWGVSTRGYLHLLGHHLCLPLDQKQGVPAAMASSACAESCVSGCCGDAACSYTDKGKAPCFACMACGTCVEEHAQEERNNNGNRNSKEDNYDYYCHVEYPSMHAARKIWAKWRKTDEKNGHRVL